MLDIHTLILVLIVSHALSTLVIFLNWRLAPNVPGVKDWAIGRLLVALALVAFALRGNSPLIVSVLIGNGLIFWGSFCIWRGSRRFLKAPEISATPYHLAITAVLAFFAYYTVAEDSLLMRGTASSLFLAVYSALYVWIIIKYNREDYLSVKVFAFVIGFHGLFHLGLAVSYGTLLGSNDLLAPSTAFAAFFFEGLVISILSACLYISMTAEYLNRDLKEQASYDPLTHTVNRRAFFPLAEHTLERRKREFSPVSLLMLDLDHFKQINDNFGHATGDKILRGVAAALHTTLRSQDVLCRYGGEEFVVLCPNTKSQDAARIAERARQVVADLQIEFQGQTLRPTISVGYATYPSNCRTNDLLTLIEAADIGLYAAKNAGRNRVERGFPKAEVIASA